MGFEYTRYKAKCRKCGQAGICERGMDDWGRTSTSWDGFSNVEPDATAVGMKRLDRRDSQPICVCGSRDIEVGDVIPQEG